MVTRELPEDQLRLADRLGLDVVIEPAIEINFTGQPDRIGRRLDQNTADGWVFTSQNGVEGYRRVVEAGLQVKPPDKIYAVGEKTAIALRELGLEAAYPDTWHAIALAGLISADFEAHALPPEKGSDKETRNDSESGSGSEPDSGSETRSSAEPGSGSETRGNAEPGSGSETRSSTEPGSGSELDSGPESGSGSGRKASGNRPLLIHWAGSMSRQELGEGLNQAGIRLMKIEVYETRLLPMNLQEEPCDAILFYSPSAVEAFRRSGGFNNPLPELFAIGDTTAEVLSLESGEHVHIPPRASSEDLLELVASVLNTGSQSSSSTR